MFVISARQGAIDIGIMLLSVTKSIAFFSECGVHHTIADPKLSLFTGEEEDVDTMDVNDRPQHKITDFT